MGVMPGVLGGHVGPGAAGGDGVDGDVTGGQLGSQVAGQRHDRCLAGRVQAVLEDGDPGADRGHQDDPASVGHLRYRGLHHKELACDVGVEHAPEILLGDRGQRPEVLHPGVTDENVETAHGLRGLADHGLRRGPVGDVALDRERYVAGVGEFGHQRSGAVGSAAVGDGDGRALGGEPAGHRGADSAATAGDKCPAVVETLHRGFLRDRSSYARSAGASPASPWTTLRQRPGNGEPQAWRGCQLLAVLPAPLPQRVLPGPARRAAHNREPAHAAADLRAAVARPALALQPGPQLIVAWTLGGIGYFWYLARRRPAMIEAMGRVWEPDPGPAAKPIP